MRTVNHKEWELGNGLLLNRNDIPEFWDLNHDEAVLDLVGKDHAWE